MEKIDKIFVINLDRREDRLEEFFKICPISKNNISRFKAIDGQELKINNEIQSLFNDNRFGWLRGKIGCALSHYQIWTENQDKNNIIIFEDDIQFINNFKKNWKEIKDNLPKDFDLIPLNMEYYIEDYKVSKKRNRKEIFGNKVEDHNKSFLKIKEDISSLGNFGTCSYLISKSGINKLLERAKNDGIKEEIDNFINQTKNLNVYLPKNYLITHSSFGGTDVTFYSDKSLI
jgi:GR25 family glycosyltransferase involved in LPS biosynthesis